MSYVDSFDTYPVGVSDAIRTGFPLSDVGAVREIVEPGKDNGRALSLSGYSLVRRGISGPTTGRNKTVRLGFTAYLVRTTASHAYNNIGSQLFDLRVAAQRRKITGYDYVVDGFGRELCYNRATLAFDLLALPPDHQQITGVIENEEYRAIAAIVGVSSDGCMRVQKGAYPQSPGAPFEALSHSAQKVPFNRWVQLEWEIYQGSEDGEDGYVYFWVDGTREFRGGFNFVLTPYAGPLYSGHQPASNYVPLPNSAAGCHFYNADAGGFFDVGLWSGWPAGSLMDDFFLMADPPITSTVPFGDLRAVPLAVTGDVSAESEIDGTTPASTHWESVVADDGDVTRVDMPTSGLTDLYAHDALPGSPEVKALAVHITARARDDGSTVAAVIDDGAAQAASSDLPVPVSGSEYVEVSQIFLTAPDASAWDATKINASNIGARRTT